MPKKHQYLLTVQWTGNQGEGTASYSSYSRSHKILSGAKEIIHASSDPAFRGDATRYNPEELLVASLSSCHMLWFLHLCAEAGVVVTDYKDDAAGTMEETKNGSGCFTEVTLHPHVTVAKEDMIARANKLHSKANELCFIANSCNFPVYHKATYVSVSS